MSAWNVTSAARILVSGFEVSRRATPAHSPHGGETCRGQGLCQGRVGCAAKRSESLDTSRIPAMLSTVGRDICQSYFQELTLSARF